MQQSMLIMHEARGGKDGYVLSYQSRDLELVLGQYDMKAALRCSNSMFLEASHTGSHSRLACVPNASASFRVVNSPLRQSG